MQASLFYLLNLAITGYRNDSPYVDPDFNGVMEPPPSAIDNAGPPVPAPPPPSPSKAEVDKPLDPEHRRANAVLIFLCRNSDLGGVVSSVTQMEERFNKDYGYPWVFLNEEPFTEEFKTYALLTCREWITFSN